jgi:hypothetical protein
MTSRKALWSILFRLTSLEWPHWGIYSSCAVVCSWPGTCRMCSSIPVIHGCQLYRGEPPSFAGGGPDRHISPGCGDSNERRVPLRPMTAALHRHLIPWFRRLYADLHGYRRDSTNPFTPTINSGPQFSLPSTQRNADGQWPSIFSLPLLTWSPPHTRDWLAQTLRISTCEPALQMDEILE